MITKANLLTEYPKVDQTRLPKPLQKEEFDFIAENMDLADEDPDIKKLVDTFIEKLNQVIEKQNNTATKPVTNKKAEKTANTVTTKKKHKAETKEKAAKTVRPDVPKVDQVTTEVALIRGFCNLQGRVKTKTQVYTYIKKLQKAIADKQVRKTSVYAGDIEYMQKHIIAVFNDMKSGTITVKIPDDRFKKLKEIAGVKLAGHVTIIRAYINILNETKTGLMAKAKALHAKIAKSSFDASAKKAIDSIRQSLADYIAGNTATPTINEFDLQGLYGLAGLNGLGELPDTANTDNKVVSAADFRNASFNLVGFTGKWLQLVGDPSTPFKMMVWGTGGSGKSTLAIELAKYLAGTLGKRVLYIANEEGAGATLHEKMTRLNAFHPNLFITKQLTARLVEYDYVFCDSANSMQMEVSRFEQAAKLYPKLSWVLLFQTTKDGKFLGEKNWQHAVDVEVYCHEGKARALKSRFGGKEVVEIRFE